MTCVHLLGDKDSPADGRGVPCFSHRVQTTTAYVPWSWRGSSQADGHPMSSPSKEGLTYPWKLRNLMTVGWPYPVPCNLSMAHTGMGLTSNHQRHCWCTLTCCLTGFWETLLWCGFQYGLIIKTAETTRDVSKLQTLQVNKTLTSSPSKGC